MTATGPRTDTVCANAGMKTFTYTLAGANITHVILNTTHGGVVACGVMPSGNGELGRSNMLTDFDDACVTPQQALQCLAVSRALKGR